MKPTKKSKAFWFPFWFYLVFYLVFVSFCCIHQIKLVDSYKDIVPFHQMWDFSGYGTVMQKEEIFVQNADGSRRGSQKVRRYCYHFAWSESSSADHSLHTGVCYSKDDLHQTGDPVEIVTFRHQTSLAKIKDTFCTTVMPRSIYMWGVKFMIMALGFPLLIYVIKLDQRRSKKKKKKTSNAKTAPLS